MALVHVPGTGGVRLAFWWFFLASAFLYLPFQVGRIGMRTWRARLGGPSVTSGDDAGGPRPGAT